MDTKALRQKVLDLAIRGKLVPQDPNDEPASVLLERIRQEKQQMVKEGKLKPKDIKNDSVIFKGEDNLHYEKFADETVKCIEDETPFEVPAGWSISNFSFIAELISGRDLKPDEYNSDKVGVPYITGASNFSNGRIIINRWTSNPQVSSIKNDILLTCKGTVGEIAINEYDNVHIARQIMAIRTNPNINIEYLKIYFLSVVSDIKNSADGLIPGISRSDILDLFIPIPPAAEQLRIVESVQESLLLIDSIDTTELELETIISLMKSKILDLAIRGKLVPQNPNDEPASVLLERIREEKEELIKQGKIKRDKNESIIFKGDDNSYYEDIPDSWELATLGMITNDKTLNDGDWILSENMCQASNIKLIQLGSVGNMQYIDKGFKYISEETFEELKCTEIYPEYILINRIVSDRMNVCIVPKIEGRLITTVDTCWIAPSGNYNSEYLMYVLSSNSFQKIVNHYSRGTTRKRISKGNLIRIAIPFPPIQEQNRIVESINKAFSTLESI